MGFFFFISITFAIFGLKSTKILNHSHKEQQVGKFEKIRSFLDWFKARMGFLGAFEFMLMKADTWDHK